jgi:periplasmic protein TonB
MFETAVVRAQTQAAPRRVGMLSASIAVHTFAGAAIIIASIHSLQFPTNAPRQTEFLIPVAAPPIQQGDTHGGRLEQPKPKQVAAALPKVQTAPPDAAPHVIPEQTPTTVIDPNANASTTPTDGGINDDLIGNGNRRGDPNGVKEGGMPPDGQIVPSEPTKIYKATEVTPPVVITRVSPEYPRLAVAAHRSGFAIVECVIDNSGHIRDARVVGSSWEVFEKPALDAVQQWVFKPGVLNGQAVNTLFELKVTFTLH